MRPLTLLAPALLIMLACSYGDRPDPYRPPGIEERTSRDGHELYLRDCAFCHGGAGQGTRNGPDLTSATNGPALTDFMLRTGRMPIDDPNDRIVHRMARLTDREIDAIVDHVTSFGGRGPEIRRPRHERADLSEGMRMYQQHCAACHSTTAIGGTLTEGPPTDATGRVARRGGSVAPSLLESTPIEIAEATRTGPGTMPRFGDDTLDDEQVDAIVRYVLRLQSNVDRGGASIGRIGPVAEGAVAMLFGLGALVLFVRWMGGTRGTSAGRESA